MIYKNSQSQNLASTVALISVVYFNGLRKKERRARIEQIQSMPLCSIVRALRKCMSETHTIMHTHTHTHTVIADALELPLERVISIERQMQDRQ